MPPICVDQIPKNSFIKYAKFTLVIRYSIAITTCDTLHILYIYNHMSSNSINDSATNTLAMKLLSRKMLAGPASRVYWELLVAVACRKECGERRGTET